MAIMFTNLGSYQNIINHLWLIFTQNTPLGPIYSLQISGASNIGLEHYFCVGPNPTNKTCICEAFNPLLPNVAYRRRPLNVARSRTSPIVVANSVSNLEAFFSPLSQVLRKIYTG
jgi:hypothetical protein